MSQDAPTSADFEHVLDFWLGELDANGCASSETSARWWKKSEEFDAEIRERFGPAREAICRGECEHWLASPRGRLAYVIVLDQLSRNMFRGTASMYAEDARAVRVVVEGLRAGCDQALGYHERYFLYMPLMHAEDLAHQEHCVASFEGMRSSFPSKSADIDRAVSYAEKHREIVKRFDRFPHRNDIMERESTAEEVSFLAGPDSSF